jgi:hypothetical protein
LRSAIGEIEVGIGLESGRGVEQELMPGAEYFRASDPDQ